MSLQRERRALIVKMGAIGDVIMAIPAVQAIHREGYTVDWVCGEVAAPILRLYPWMNVVAVDEQALFRASGVSRLKTIAGLWRQLAARSYDLCATLYYDNRYKVLTIPVRAKRRVMLSRGDRRHALLAGRHHTDEYARILLERRDDETPYQLAPIPAIGLPTARIRKNSGRPRAVIVPAGARNALRDDALRRWPLEGYVEVARELLSRGVEVVLAGGPDDVWASPAFAALGVTNLIGQMSLIETLAMMESAEVTVTHDTGPLHMAGITSTAIVTIFGPTDPYGRLPQRANCVALWGGEGFACRPCYDGRDYAPCTHNGCMRQVTVPMVLSEIERMIEAKRSEASLLPRVIVPEHTPLVQLELGR